MSALLGTVNFEDVEVYYGYKLTETDKKIWDEYFNQCADFSDAKQLFSIMFSTILKSPLLLWLQLLKSMKMYNFN